VLTTIAVIIGIILFLVFTCFVAYGHAMMEQEKYDRMEKCEMSVSALAGLYELRFTDTLNNGEYRVPIGCSEEWVALLLLDGVKTLAKERGLSDVGLFVKTDRSDELRSHM